MTYTYITSGGRCSPDPPHPGGAQTPCTLGAAPPNNCIQGVCDGRAGWRAGEDSPSLLSRLLPSYSLSLPLSLSLSPRLPVPLSFPLFRSLPFASHRRLTTSPLPQFLTVLGAERDPTCTSLSPVSTPKRLPCPSQKLEHPVNPMCLKDLCLENIKPDVGVKTYACQWSQTYNKIDSRCLLLL